MVMIPPMEKWRSHYTFSTSRVTTPTDFTHYVVVVIDTTKTAQLKLDGAALSGVTFKAIGTSGMHNPLKY